MVVLGILMDLVMVVSSQVLTVAWVEHMWDWWVVWVISLGLVSDAVHGLIGGVLTLVAVVVMIVVFLSELSESVMSSMGVVSVMGMGWVMDLDI